MSDKSENMRFNVLAAGISDGESRILFGVERGRYTHDLLQSNIGRRLRDAGLIRAGGGDGKPELTRAGTRLASMLAKPDGNRPVSLYVDNSETLLRMAGEGKANAYGPGWGDAAVELLNDRLVRLDIASGRLTPTRDGEETLARFDKAD